MNNNLLRCYEKFNLFNFVIILLCSGAFGTVFETAVTFITSGGHIYKRFLFVLPIVYMFAISGGIIYIFGILYKKMVNTISICNITIYYICSSIFLGAFEALSGMLLKKLGIEMWNYSWMAFTITDYTTVPIILVWGILSTLGMLMFIPFLIRKISKISEPRIITIILIIVIIVDFTGSIHHAYNDPQFMHYLVYP